MRTSYLAYAAKLRQYRHLAKQVDGMLKDGSFRNLAFSKQKKLLLKLRERLKSIGRLLPQRRLKECLAGIAVLLATGLANPLAGQTFLPGVASPFGLEGSTMEGFSAFADLDGDGDQDLLNLKFDNYSYSATAYFYENTGTPTAPEFGVNVETDPFGLENMPPSLATLAFADLDDDGDLDLMAGTRYYGGFYFFQNTGSATSPAFSAPLFNPFGLSPDSYVDFPTLVDLDNDGDLDLLSGGSFSSFRYFENIGTAASPDFASVDVNPFGFNTSAMFTIPNFIDADKDGDYDLIYFEYNYYSFPAFSYAENIGTPESPQYAPGFSSPFGITTNNFETALPNAIDIDNDGDTDIFISDYYGDGVVFYENDDTNYPPSAANALVTLEEDEPHFFSVEDFNYSDINNDPMQALEIISLPLAGSLTFNNNPVSAGQIISAFGLPGLRYQSLPNDNGSPYASFGFRVFDGEFWSNEEYLMNLDVTPVNDFPLTGNSAITAFKDTDFVFAETDFPFDDIDGDSFSALRIATSVDKGSLTLNGAAVSPNQLVPLSNIAQLVFTPAPGESGAPYTQFQFQVSDGSVFSPQVAVMTINVDIAGASGQLHLDAELAVSPNPAGDVLNVNIKAKSAMDKPQLKIYNATGMELQRERWSGAMPNLEAQLDVSGLAPGLYWVKVEAGGKAAVAKFVKG
jgi:hypothetical protein